MNEISKGYRHRQEYLHRHELGHGQFVFKHPFDNSYGLSQNVLPDNLMDYGNGTHLAKWQWDLVFDPGIVMKVFERDEDGMAVGYTIDFTSSENFVKFDKSKHENFIQKYTSAYKSFQINKDVSSYPILNKYLYISVDNKTYKTNSVSTIFGRDHNDADIGRFHNIFEIDDLLKIIIGHSNYIFYDIYMSQPIEICVKSESVGLQAKLDYKWELFRILKEFGINQNDLGAIDGVAYNANEIGNYIWGMVLTYHGVFISSNLIAELGTEDRKDEPWEQRAITKGREKTKTFNFSEQDKEDILKYRLSFRLQYKDADASWRELEPFFDLKK